MKFERMDEIEGKTVVVLGAGATRGCEPVAKKLKTGEALPPLDADFFTQAQRLQKGRDQVHQLIEDAVDIFGTNFCLTMETFLTQIEHLSWIHESHKVPGRPRRNPYLAVRHNFLQVIALLLDETLGHNPDCPYHKGLAEVLRSGDVVMNFNYDCLFDNALRLHGGGRWNARDGYGVLAYAEPHTDYWSGKSPAMPKSKVHHLKMHGSLHWWPTDPAKTSQSSPLLHLKERWWRQRGNVRFDLVPPEWNKRIDRGVYRLIWRKARAALRSAEVLVFVGYSMPPGDLPVQALMRIDAVRNKSGGQTHPLKAVIIANPNQEARYRIRDVLHDRIDNQTRVLVYDSFEQLHHFLNG